MNWGYKVTLLYLGFACMIGFLAFGAVSQEYFLVTKSYYEEEIKYEETLDKLRNAKKLETPLAVSIDRDHHKLLLSFPAKQQSIEGVISLYRPSNANLDQSHEIELSETTNAQSISTSSLKPGLWKVKIAWENEGTAYLVEESIII